jgi:hypothetical protein
MPPFNVDMSSAETPDDIQRIQAEQNKQAQRYQFGDPQNPVRGC